MVAYVSALMHEGLVELKCVAQDGMRTRVSAGSSSFRRAESIKECQKQLEQPIEFHFHFRKRLYFVGKLQKLTIHCSSIRDCSDHAEKESRQIQSG